MIGTWLLFMKISMLVYASAVSFGEIVHAIDHMTSDLQLNKIAGHFG